MTARQRLRREDGFTIIELVTAMSVFTLFVIIFIAAIAGFTGSIISARATAEGASANQTVLSWMDRRVRYAEAINFPGEANGKRYIEFFITRSVTDTGLAGCMQWRYDPAEGRIQSREWSVTDGGAAVGVSEWSTKANQVVDQGGVDYPFAMIPADDTVGVLRQRLRLTLENGIAGRETSQLVTEFVARNSSSVSATNNDANGDGQSDTQVCMQEGRP